jgi:hypothetical protein
MVKKKIKNVLKSFYIQIQYSEYSDLTLYLHNIAIENKLQLEMEYE